ncbi:MAG TPA: DHH family phosphoesterase [Candidatus Pacearchaeota archaeon]|nr:DHH family phosphoesterase [Candidatus Pacearchaeota archaeon]
MKDKIRNIEIAASRIKEAVLNEEQIIIYGDSDMDGVASVVILEEAINNLTSILKKDIPQILVAFPDRDNEGYGLNENALAFLNKKRANNKKALLITLDCGITNFKEIEEAKKLGFDVVVVDHHKVLDKIPNADIIVDPKHPEDNYYFKEYSNAGLTFKLVEEILKQNMSSFLRSNFIELVMLATIADMMPEEDENQEWIYEGLANLDKTQRPAILAFKEVLGSFHSKREFVNKIISVFNTVKMKDHKVITYDFIKSINFEDAKEKVRELIKDTEDRQNEIRALTENLKEHLKIDQSIIIFEGSKQYRADYLGAVASRLVGFFNKPVFLYVQKEDVSRGTVRVPKGIDAVKAMDSCKNLLVTYGGHAPAAGFTLKNENLDQFKDCLIKYFSK